MQNLYKTARIFYGIGILCIGIQQFIYGDFRPMILQEWPAWIHASPIWAYIVGVIWLLSGAAIIVGKNVRTVSLLFGGFLFLCFVFFHLPYNLIFSPNLAKHVGLWVNPLKELALSGGAFVMAGFFTNERGAWNNNSLIRLLEKFIPLGRIFFSITMIIFGYSHFLYAEFVSALVPAWIGAQMFWTYFAAVALICSGIAIILKFQIRLVSLLLGIMLFLWVILLHIPRAIADPYVEKGNEVTSVFEALAFSGIAFVISGLYKEKMPAIKTALS